MKYDYPWIDFSRDYHSWVLLLGSFPPGQDAAMLSQYMYAILKAKYADADQLKLRSELLTCAINTIHGFEPELIADKHLVELPGTTDKELSGSALGAVYELIVIRGIKLPDVTLVLKTANRLAFERGTDSGETPP